jgi:hypothetical protein
MDESIHRADPALRRRTLLRLAAMTIVGGAVIVWGLPWLLAVLQEAKLAGTVRARVICYAFLAFLGGLALLVAGFGAGVARDGRRISELERFPLPDAVVLRDTKVIRGRQAKRIGRGNTVVGYALVACAAALLLLSGYGAYVIATR